MRNIKKKVEETFKWKKGVDFCAQKLGISNKEYLDYKSQILQSKKNNIDYSESIDLEKGEGKLSINSTTEPKSPEEIIKLLNIDTDDWKLSQYWNKQMGDHWRVSALITKIKKETSENYFENLLNNWKPKTYKIPKHNLLELNKNKTAVCGVMSLQDIHFGKEGNETIDKDFEDTVINLMTRAVTSHHIENLYFVLGGDLINMDTFGGTTTSGTPLDNCSSATVAYMQAFDAMHWAINYMKQFCVKLTVVYIPGNHDRLSSFHLAHALSKSILSDDIEWDVQYAERKVHVWHDNFNAFEHGDRPSKNTPLVYATEYPLYWGNTRNRTLFTGHYHTERKVEYNTTSETTGFIQKTLPSLCKTDYYHYHNKYVGNKRSGKLELQHPVMGNICELTFQAM